MTDEPNERTTALQSNLNACKANYDYEPGTQCLGAVLWARINGELVGKCDTCYSKADGERYKEELCLYLAGEGEYPTEIFDDEKRGYRLYPYGNPKTEKGARAIIQLIKEKFDNKEYGYAEGLWKTWLRVSVGYKALPFELRREARDMYFTHCLPAENIALEKEMKRYKDANGWYSGTISDNNEKIEAWKERKLEEGR